MALFVINRYLGDDENLQEDAGEDHTNALLERLQEKAKAREKQMKNASTKAALCDDDEPGIKKKKKKPKPKFGEEESNEVKDLKNVTVKKRKKMSQVSSVELDTKREEEDDEDGHKEIIKKKGKRKEKTTNRFEFQKPAEIFNSELDNGVEKIAEEKHLSKKKRQSLPKSSTPRSVDSSATDSEMETDVEMDIREPEQKSLSGENVQTEAPASVTILGDFKKNTIQQKVHRVLPHWLAQPSLVEKDIKSNLIPIEEVPGICPKLLRKLQHHGVKHFFPVQKEVIPAILDGASNGLLIGKGGYRPNDICVSAPTGSGKTLAFVIPVVQVLMQRVVCNIRCLVVLPTKELAQQVYKVFNTYIEGTNLKVVMVAGQKPFEIEQASLVQNKIFGCQSLADIVVATPGRLVDHICKTPGFNLQHLRYLIIDEADRMIDSMHQDWLRQVMKAVYQGDSNVQPGSLFRRMDPGPVTANSFSQLQMPLQKLLFSATLSHNPEKLQKLGLYLPRLFTSNYSRKENSELNASTKESDAVKSEEKINFPKGLTEYYVPCTLNNKPLIILDFMLRLKFNPVLCFTNSREASHRLYLLVREFGGVKVAEFSSRLSPGERKKTLKMFEKGKIQLLISTDAMARGIDIQGVKCVINYDAPQFIRTYVHRVGRTARAGKAGLAFTLLLRVQEHNFIKMLQDAGSPGIEKQFVDAQNLKPLIPQYQVALAELQSIIKEEKAQKRV
uniref:ATP-dependent RNA helicase n=1 Tax=Erpetoichthys calabaricus TaxID=27687 RepID=A0A8C4T408_ERPCA